MGQPVKITTAFPSVEETARIAGVSLARAKELVTLARASGFAFRRSGLPRFVVARKAATKRARSKAGKS